MRYLSLFSGIEAATVAWHPLSWECAAVAEIEPFPCSVLAHHYPHVPNLGDVTQVTEADIALLGPLDLVVFGSPCQDLSVAGKRKGLAGARSGLFHTAINIIEWAREHCGCRFALWENVPGAFSSNKGRDFAAVVGELAGLADVGVPANGWGTEGCAVGDHGLVEWATLDAQWFGVAQRRRRVFALADFGDWNGRPPVLLEPHGLRGDSAPSREAGQTVVVGTLGGTSPGGGWRIGADEAAAGQLVPVGGSGVAVETFVAYSTKLHNTASNQAGKFGVRRLTPRECERLQGFPDDYTLIPHRGKPAADGPRYKALGNSMAVPVMRHIGERLQWSLDCESLL